MKEEIIPNVKTTFNSQTQQCEVLLLTIWNVQINCENVVIYGINMKWNLKVINLLQKIKISINFPLISAVANA